MFIPFNPNPRENLTTDCRQGNYSSNYPNSYSGNKDAMRQKLSQMMTELDSM